MVSTQDFRMHTRTVECITSFSSLHACCRWGDMAPHIGAKIAPRLEVKQNQTLLRIPSMQGRLMRSISAKGMAVTESTAR